MNSKQLKLKIAELDIKEQQHNVDLARLREGMARIETLREIVRADKLVFFREFQRIGK